MSIKPLSLVIISILLLLVIVCPAFAWWDTAYKYRADTPITNGTRPYQISFNLSSGAGINNATHLYCNDHCNVNFTDIRFTLNNVTALSYWIEDNMTGKVWVNVTGNGTVNMYYGNPSATASDNGTLTFPFFDHFVGSSLDSKWAVVSSGGGTATVSNSIVDFTDAAAPWTVWGSTGALSFIPPYSMEAKTRVDSDANYWLFGLGNTPWVPTNDALYVGYESSKLYYSRKDNTQSSWVRTSTATSYNIMGIINDGSNAQYSYNRGGTDATATTNVPVDPVYADFRVTSGRHLYVDWIYIKNYSSPEPQWATWVPENGILIESPFNNYTSNNTLTFTILSNATISFNVSASGEYNVDSYSWYLNTVDQSVSTNATNISISAARVNNVTVIVKNNTNSITQSITWNITLPFNLLTPTNSSTLYGVFPPMKTPTYFSWSTVGYPYYELYVAKDSNFNLVTSYITSNTYRSVDLEPSDYWWKVRYYDDSTGSYGPWSDTFNFTLTNSENATGTGIHGIVYEIISDEDVPVSGATVTLYSATLNESSTQSVGVNGYYLFSNLRNDTVYYVYATMSGYDPVTPLPMTTVPGNISTYNIQLRRTVNPYIVDYVDAQFQLLYLDSYSPIYDAIVTVHEYDNPLPYATGITAFAGIVTFKLDLHQRYNVTFEDVHGNIYATSTNTVGIYPKSMNIVYVINETHIVTPTVVNNTVFGNITGTWGIYDFTNTSLQSTYQIGPKGQGLIMSIIALFMIPYGGIVAMIVIAFGFAYLGLLSYPFVMVSGVFCAAWYLIKKEFT